MRKARTTLPPKSPHAQFIERSITAFLYDSVTFKIVWSDTATGGLKGAIKEFYFNWNGDTIFNDSMSGTALDTFVFSKTFPPEAVTVRMKAEDYDGEYSAIDSMQLVINPSRPRIDSISAPSKVAKAANCTLSVSASDTGGVIQSFLWAKDGANFSDTTAHGAFFVSFTDTGEKAILVKARDNKSVESAIDTFHIGIYDKIYATFYDGNGSTGGTAPVDKNKYIQGQSDTVLDNTGALVKPGFAFSGWNTMADGRGASYAAGFDLYNRYRQRDLVCAMDERPHLYRYLQRKHKHRRDRPDGHRSLHAWTERHGHGQHRVAGESRVYFYRVEHAGKRFRHKLRHGR